MDAHCIACGASGRLVVSVLWPELLCYDCDAQAEACVIRHSPDPEERARFRAYESEASG